MKRCFFLIIISVTTLIGCIDGTQMNPMNQDFLRSKSQSTKNMLPIIISAPSNQTIQISKPVSFTVKASRGALKYQWKKDNIEIPGAISSTYRIAAASINDNGTYQVVVSNSAGSVITDGAILKVYDDIAPLAPLTLKTTDLARGIVGTAYNETLFADGGKPPYLWSISEGNLQSGLALNAIKGVIEGTPDVAKTSTLTFQVKDSNGSTNNKTPFNWSIANGSLQSGLHFSSDTGMISGTPKEGGIANITIKVVDSANNSATQDLSIFISDLAIKTTTLPNVTTGSDYSQLLTAEGGEQPYLWSITPDNGLPAGLILDSNTGNISGSSLSQGVSDFTINVEDRLGSIASQAITITTLDWTIPVPTPFDVSVYGLTDIQQPGSRIFYISADGSDPSDTETPLKQIYFWNGNHIIDATGSTTGADGELYGTDPMNPTGLIRPYKSWPFVAPRRTGWGIGAAKVGAPWDGTSYKAPGGGEFRYGFPDWWLFKRGDTFNLKADYLSFAQKTAPSLTETSGGSLTLPGGANASKTQVMGAYGNLNDPRPRFINPNSTTFLIQSNRVPPKHIIYLSLHFDGRGTVTSNGFSFRDLPAESENILLEDIWLEALGGSDIQHVSAQITLRRALITDGFSIGKGHVQGLYTSGNRDAKIRIEQSILMRNGFKNGDPAIDWPPSGAQTWNIFNRNMYLSGECNNMVCGVFDTISLIGASGDQFRPGMRVERNFFYQGYLALGAHGGYPDSDGPTGSFIDNILQRFVGSGTNDNRGHPGWGIELTSGSYKVEMARNIVTGAQHEAKSYGLYISALNWYCYSHNFEYATRNNNIYDNIFDTGTAPAAINISDGEGENCNQGWTFPGVTNNQITNNILINNTKKESVYKPSPALIGTTNDTLFIDNALYANRTTAAAELRWPDTERTLKTYLQSLGITVTSEDGFIEYFHEAKQQRRGYWRTEYTSRPLINYIREGFAMPHLP